MRLIRKYPNRRLYDTEKSSYITLADVLKLIRDSVEFEVRDSESNEDLTRAILIQIITEQEGGDRPIFTTETLTKFIRFYDDANQAMFGDFLNRNMSYFTEQQQKITDQITTSLGTPLHMMKEFTERNLDLWQSMQRKFFDIATGQKPDTPTPDDTPAPKSKTKKKGGKTS